ncbi:MAG: hypothetical protein WBK88_03825 [Methanothrix sp.]
MIKTRKDQEAGRWKIYFYRKIASLAGRSTRSLGSSPPPLRGAFK